MNQKPVWLHARPEAPPCPAPGRPSSASVALRLPGPLHHDVACPLLGRQLGRQRLQRLARVSARPVLTRFVGLLAETRDAAIHFVQKRPCVRRVPEPEPLEGKTRRTIRRAMPTVHKTAHFFKALWRKCGEEAFDAHRSLALDGALAVQNAPVEIAEGHVGRDRSHPGILHRANRDPACDVEQLR